MIESASTGLLWLSYNAYFEARNQSFNGMKLTVQTVMNRTMQRNMGVVACITQSKQYSWYNGNVIPPILEPNSLFECNAAAYQVYFIDRMNGDIANGATHYHHIDITPYWVKDRKMVYLQTEGKHAFYREERRNY